MFFMAADASFSEEHSDVLIAFNKRVADAKHDSSLWLGAVRAETRAEWSSQFQNGQLGGQFLGSKGAWSAKSFPPIASLWDVKERLKGARTLPVFVHPLPQHPAADAQLCGHRGPPLTCVPSARRLGNVARPPCALHGGGRLAAGHGFPGQRRRVRRLLD